MCRVQAAARAGPRVLVKGSGLRWSRLIRSGPEILLDETLVLGRLTGSGHPRNRRARPGWSRSGTILDCCHVSMWEFRLVEWTVQILDPHSANGTYVSTPNTVEVRLAPGRPHILIPGFAYPGRRPDRNVRIRLCGKPDQSVMRSGGGQYLLSGVLRGTEYRLATRTQVAPSSMASS